VFAVPEHATIEVRSVSLQLCAVEVATSVVSEVVERSSLDRPLADEDGVSGTSVRLSKVASSVCGVVGVTSADKEVDVCIEDDVSIDVGPIRVPCLGPDEPVGEGHGHGGRLLANLLESCSIVLVEISYRVLSLAEVVQRRKRFVDQ
jgi:hypothetical protein